MERNFLKRYNIRVLILSRSRYNSITTHKLLPAYIEVLVPESEKKFYEKVITNPILTVPDKIVGLGKLRNWVLDNFEEETVIMLDDDISIFYCISGEKTRRVDDKCELLQILINTAIMAKEAGCKVFGFSQTDIRKFKGTDPFLLCTWVGGIVGVIGRKYSFRNDKFKVDIDYCLQNLLVERIVWCDNRYFPYQQRDNNVGGNSLYRTEEDYRRSLETLKKKWGRYLKEVKSHTSNISLKLNVKRRAKVKYE